ncbi:MAG: metal ABC transporter substrate-binding protein [Chthoniobacterales bacterium]
MRALLFSFLLGVAPTLFAEATNQLTVVSFSTVLTEIAEQVGGTHTKVLGLVIAGEDPHEYQPTPADLDQVSKANLVLLSGKHLEHYLDKIQQATGGKVDSLPVGDQLPSLQIKSNSDEEATAAPAEQTAVMEDPHWWHSVANVKKATTIVSDELAKLDPANKADYEKNAMAYLANLDQLDKWVRRKIAELPRNRRKLVTSHDAFQYFARDYGFTIYAIEGVSTDTEPSNRHVAQLIDEIKQQDVKAIFLESNLNPKVTSEITRETGVSIGGTLYADGLGTGAASTYDGMFRHNVTIIVEALK